MAAYACLTNDYTLKTVPGTHVTSSFKFKPASTVNLGFILRPVPPLKRLGM